MGLPPAGRPEAPRGRPRERVVGPTHHYQAPTPPQPLTFINHHQHHHYQPPPQPSTTIKHYYHHHAKPPPRVPLHATPLSNTGHYVPSTTATTGTTAHNNTNQRHKKPITTKLPSRPIVFTIRTNYLNHTTKTKNCPSAYLFLGCVPII